MNEEFLFRSIGVVRSPFAEKFGVPRQSGMLSLARGVLELRPEADFRRAVQDLGGFSHLWVIFVFHKDLKKTWTPEVMTPRVELERKIGVLSTRSPHRPNPIGLSALKIERIDVEAKPGAKIYVSGLDLLDGTPILDIKPYIPYCDSISEASGAWASNPIEKFPVFFSEESLEMIQTKIQMNYPDFQKFITQIVELDPRPTTYRKGASLQSPSSAGRRFAFRVLHFDIHCELRPPGIEVTKIIDLECS
jgi:tRNA-Thr(GGU) m(6)t(6)A37 methyltransferase TsaA